MAPKKQKTSIDASQPTIAAAFSKPSRVSDQGDREPLGRFVRVLPGVEFDDYTVNNIFNNAGAKVTADEAERADDGARTGSGARSHACAAADALRRCARAELLFVEAVHETMLAQPQSVVPQCAHANLAGALLAPSQPLGR